MSINWATALHYANSPSTGVPEVPKTGTGISNSGRDAGVVAGIVIAVITGVVILAALVRDSTFLFHFIPPLSISSAYIVSQRRRYLLVSARAFRGWVSDRERINKLKISDY